jgi:hypothetical protein
VDARGLPFDFFESDFIGFETFRVVDIIRWVLSEIDSEAFLSHAVNWFHLLSICFDPSLTLEWPVRLLVVSTCSKSVTHEILTLFSR